MPVTDPISDMLTRIRNAIMARREEVEVPASRIKLEIARILRQEGFIRGYEFIDDGKQGILRIRIKYAPGRESIIHGIKRISKPGRRVYVKKGAPPRVMGGLGIAILSTSRGVMTDREARKLGVGGEVICYVW